MRTSPPAEPVPGQSVAWASAYLEHLRDAHAVERATVPVEKIRGPVLLVSGMDDQMWPSSVLADIATRRLEAHEFPFPFQHLCYEGAGHTIKVPYGPLTVRVSALGKRYSGMLYSQGGTAEADAEARADAWRKQSVFLRDAIEGRA